MRRWRTTEQTYGKIKFDINHMTNDDEIAYMGPIVTKMTGNSAFTTLAAKTTTAGTALTAFTAANADVLATETTLDQKRTILATPASPPKMTSATWSSAPRA